MRSPPVLLDQEKLFGELNRREAQLRRELGRLESELRRFEDADRPAYDRWLRLEFGPELQDLEDLYAEIRIGKIKAQRIHDYVQAGYHPREARYLVETPPEKEQGDLFEGVSGWSEDEIEARRRAKRDAKREARRQARRDEKRAKVENRSEKPSGETGPSRLTSLYRILVRKLHPDSPLAVRSVPAERLRSLWHEVQEAYKRRETDRLLTIATWLESQGGESEAVIRSGISYSERQKLYRGLEKSMRKLVERLKSLRLDPAWGFARHSNPPAKLRKAVRRQLQEELARAREVGIALEEYFDGIGPPRKPRRRR